MYVIYCSCRELCRAYTEAYTKKLVAKSVSAALKSQLEVNLLNPHLQVACQVLHTSPGVHNEIHDTQKPSEALPGQVLQVVVKVIKGQRAGKGRILFLDQTTKGTMEAQRAQCPSVEA